MVQAIPASSLTLFEVIEKFQFQNTFEDEFESCLKLEPLTETVGVPQLLTYASTF